jgi:hypothetical protein
MRNSRLVRPSVVTEVQGTEESVGMVIVLRAGPTPMDMIEVHMEVATTTPQLLTAVL